jgi:hypothetical protein
MVLISRTESKLVELANEIGKIEVSFVKKTTDEIYKISPENKSFTKFTFIALGKLAKNFIFIKYLKFDQVCRKK